jgi:hypothetical protein
VSWYQIPVDLIALFPRTVPIAIDPQYQEAVRSIGGTCDRFTTNYFERKLLYLNGGKSVARAPDIFERAG